MLIAENKGLECSDMWTPHTAFCWVSSGCTPHCPFQGLLHWLTKIDTESFREKRSISSRMELRHCPATTPSETSGYTRADSVTESVTISHYPSWSFSAQLSRIKFWLCLTWGTWALGQTAHQKWQPLAPPLPPNPPPPIAPPVPPLFLLLLLLLL